MTAEDEPESFWFPPVLGVNVAAFAAVVVVVVVVVAVDEAAAAGNARPLCHWRRRVAD